MSKSGFPFREAGQMSQTMIDYLDGLGTPASAVADVAAVPTTTELATTLNALLAALRTSNKLET